ncbi:hypothetical protein BGZ70_002244 [Mortierella alpina]|uniref:Uncharacterized protein n=1 Tax=Mortierella alpina TaxID=64518 RepID=A0A9P6LWV4_MORAP|nr:hypothetical protein BGZ70_002244 [Mortierella alpina]
MHRPSASITTLPYELIIAIFTLSSNPSLVFTCKELHHILAPLSRSNSARINFLLIRYRHNYVKAVIKGLRWKFFDLELLSALDRLYSRVTQRKSEASARQQLHAAALLSSHSSLPWLDTAAPTNSASTTPAAPSTPTTLESIEPPRKKRKKYQIPIPESYLSMGVMGNHSRSASPADPLSNTSTTDSTSSTEVVQEIPLPKDFSMPRRLFKSSSYLPLIQQLLSRGGSPSYPSHYPLVRASQRGDVDMVRLLLSFGAPPDMKAVQQACVEEQDAVLDLFLERGVKPDTQCLSLCVEKGKTRMIDRLLKLGVVPDLKTVLGL